MNPGKNDLVKVFYFDTEDAMNVAYRTTKLKMSCSFLERRRASNMDLAMWEWWLICPRNEAVPVRELLDNLESPPQEEESPYYYGVLEQSKSYFSKGSPSSESFNLFLKIWLLLSIPLALIIFTCYPIITAFIGMTGCEPSMTTVERTTDQNELAKIAEDAKDWHVRIAAVEKLTDQALLEKVAEEHKDWDIRRTALGKLTDQALLAKIAMEDKDSHICIAAVEKLTDQVLLAKVAVEAKSFDVRVHAIRKVTDQTLLAEPKAVKMDVQETGGQK
jgi:uncharacterized membrane protein (DUF106 family)